MKSAEKWINKNPYNPWKLKQTNSFCELAPSIFEDLIKEIQLDAMREGMRRAAAVAQKEMDNNCLKPRVYAPISMTKQAILSAAEQLTEKDL